TVEIGSFKIVSESGIAAGVRRIEALTGRNVQSYFTKIEQEMQKAAEKLKASPAELTDKIAHLQEQLKKLQSENESLKRKEAQKSLGDLSETAKDVNGTKLIAASLKGVDMNGLRDLCDTLKQKEKNAVIVLVSDNGDKAQLVVMADAEAVKKGAHAGNLVKQIAPKIGGGGGGRPDMAQAGGKNPSGIADALKEAEAALSAQLIHE
ncbi:MAG: alanine--tRNA ligase, partial [Lachnospiraceae bacterium]|nr:alanine--tRNA ligase [Lachnospiraceae bacterium]